MDSSVLSHKTSSHDPQNIYSLFTTRFPQRPIAVLSIAFIHLDNGPSVLKSKRMKVNNGGKLSARLFEGGSHPRDSYVGKAKDTSD